ncbi:CaiB/BaiF CoA transferase family protein [Pseudonocardia cypriaca]|uniref:Formyl-CoA transferase n=1 Tax=Pseudonocardia cypriaca TaxID=882449 RepID=A0A543FRP1_9PSEU|nr:CaiB/BaiF CoA-transferase family protein [Pseudonocardia cypriaca]TQM36499.1 formyl-CoA transferase [Pseudonocardia cypriaca]
MTPPLQGITVVSLEQAVAAPFATRQLADLGARVIKIERPDGGDFARGYDESVHGNSSYFVWLNRSKESLTLDVKSADGRAVLGELLDRADVLVQNLGPGAAGRLGVDAASLARSHPRVIPCTVSGWGTDGPWAGRKAYDLLVQAETGVLALTGTSEHTARVGISIADIAAGMYAYSGILTALLRRATTGEVAAVEVSLFEALAEWMGSPANYTAYGGRQPARTGSDHATIAPYGPVATADGVVVLGLQNDREWRSLCAVVLEDPDLADDPRFVTNSARVEHRAELNALVEARLAHLDTDAASALLDKAGIANARLNQVRDFLDHPVLAARERWQPVDVPGGTISALRPPVDIAGVDPVMGPVPALGAHTDAILRELGRSDREIASLRDRGLV